MIVLQKYIRDSDYCSRRKAEELIRAGKVFINGKIAELGAKAARGDEIKIGKKIITAKQKKIYLKLNKPRGYTCTNRNFAKEKNIFSLLEKKYQHLHIAGRLDKDSQGLIILTNDGEFTKKITHPSYEHEKKYLVSVAALPKDDQTFIKSLILKFKKGIDIGAEDAIVKSKAIQYLGNNKFKITLTEGKKRQIRRMFKACKLNVVSLQRTSIGKIKLDDLKEGEWRPFKASQTNNYSKPKK